MLFTIMLATLFALTIFVLIEWTRPRVGTIILPAGSTYLGPSSAQ